MVSVIVPVFNVKPYLEEAIESVIHQSYEDLEIILVDDGSTDGSGDICDIFQKSDSRIKVIHQENRGLSGARNTGLDLCTGEFIAFLDPDDAFCKEAILKMLGAMTSSGAEIVECNFAVYMHSTRMDERKIKGLPKTISPKKNREGLYTKREALSMQCNENIANNVWNKLYKREIWKNLRFREGYNFEDLDIILPLIGESETLYILDEKLVMQRRRKGSITATLNLKNVMDKNISYNHYLEYIREHTPMLFSEEVHKKCIERYVRNLFATFYVCAGSRAKEKKEMLNYIRNQISDPEITETVKKCKFKVRAASFIYNHFPVCIGVMTYKIFSFVNKLLKKVF